MKKLQQSSQIREGLSHFIRTIHIAVSINHNLLVRKITILLFLTFLTIKLYSQELEYRSVEFYFEIVKKLEIEELKKVGLIDDNLKIVENFKEKGKESFNSEAFEKYAEIKVKVLQSIFKDYLYQQHLEYHNDIYVLYFSMAGFDDAQWQILKFDKTDWDRSDKIDLRLVENCKNNREDKKNTTCNFISIAFNYDEGPKNIDSVRIFIKNDYLVMERGKLYHTLYDLKKNKLILNEENPWNASGGKEKDAMDKWIKENLHDKIELVVNK